MMNLEIDKATFFDKLIISVLNFLGCVFSFVCHRPVSCVSLDCPFLIAPWIFSNVYLLSFSILNYCTCRERSL